MSTAADEIKIRITPNDKAALQRAAEIEGVSLSQFVRQVAGAQAEQVIAGARLRQITFLPPASFDAMLAALDEPAVANPLLVAAAENLIKFDLD